MKSFLYPHLLRIYVFVGDTCFSILFPMIVVIVVLFFILASRALYRYKKNIYPLWFNPADPYGILFFMTALILMLTSKDIAMDITKDIEAIYNQKKSVQQIETKTENKKEEKTITDEFENRKIKNIKEKKNE